jgi:hypothetical protein
MSEQPPETPEVPGDGQVPEDGESTPDLEAILRASQGITPDMDTAVDALAAVHARWRQAWAETGAFSPDETFELVRILVAASAGGIRSL